MAPWLRISGLLAGLLLGAACGDDAEISLLPGGGGGAGGAAGAPNGGGQSGAGAPTSCTQNAQCSGESPYCQVSSGRCVRCLQPAHCDADQACDPFGECAEACVGDWDCTSGEEPFCDLALGVCVRCRLDPDCPGAEPFCVGGRCSKCRVDLDCTAKDKPYCAPVKGECRECLTTSHCPTGKACDPDELQCKG